MRPYQTKGVHSACAWTKSTSANTGPCSCPSNSRGRATSNRPRWPWMGLLGGGTPAQRNPRLLEQAESSYDEGVKRGRGTQTEPPSSAQPRFWRDPSAGGLRVKPMVNSCCRAKSPEMMKLGERKESVSSAQVSVRALPQSTKARKSNASQMKSTLAPRCEYHAQRQY